MKRLPRWAIPPLAAATAFVVLVVAETVGIHVPGLGILDLFPRANAFDYSHGGFHGFSPLKRSFIDDVLGTATPIASHRVSSWSPAGGRFNAPGDTQSVRTTDVPPLANDDFEHATTAKGVPFAARTNTAGATRQTAEPSACGTINGGTVWFRYTPAADTGVLANTFGSSYGTVLAAYRGPSIHSLTSVVCDEDPLGNAQVSFPAKKATTYFFQIGTSALAGGDLLFRLERQGVTSLVGFSSGGDHPSNDWSAAPAISADGHWVAFLSDGGTSPSAMQHDRGRCVGGSTDNIAVAACTDVFVRDLETGRVSVASVSTTGEPANDSSELPSISGNGRYVAFQSQATNLVRDADGARCAHNTGPTGHGGQTRNSATVGCSDIFVHDQINGATVRVSQNDAGEPGNADSLEPTISDDGRYVAFESMARNLVPGDTNVCTWSNTYALAIPASATPAPSCRDVFVRDLVSGTIQRVSVSSRGEQSDEASWNPSISADGRYVAFNSYASNLVAGAPPICAHTDGEGRTPCAQIYVHDRLTRATEVVSVSSAGAIGTADSFNASISGDGRFIVFASQATNLVPGTPPGARLRLYVHDRLTGATKLVSVSSIGESANADVVWGSISGNGRYVVFSTPASNLVPGDDNYCGGVTKQQFGPCDDDFVRDLLTGTTTRISVSTAGRQATNVSYEASISWNGSRIAFRSDATNLVEGAQNTCDADSIAGLGVQALNRGVEVLGDVASASPLQGRVTRNGFPSEEACPEVYLRERPPEAPW